MTPFNDPIHGGGPVDDFLVLLDLPDSSKVARYRRERMSMECENSAQEATVRHSLASSFL